MAQMKKAKTQTASKASGAEPKKVYRSISEIRKTFYPNANVERKSSQSTRADRVRNGLL